ncbi:MAG: Uma2 family endonuclease, partial [bacterium]|nr:Uma2 family endonuclease [bacterium]
MIRESNLLLKQAEQPVIEGLESDEGLEVSEEEYWEHYYNRDDFAYEWNNGVLEVKPMADYQSTEVYLWFQNLLEEYIQYNPIAKIIIRDIGFRMAALNQKVTIRKPDLALILKSNIIDINQTDSTYKGIYDVCVEFLSDSKKSEMERDTVIKRVEYEQAGVKEYYIIDRKGNETAFFNLSPGGLYLPMRANSGIIQSTVLPGWQFRVDDLYKQPELKTLIKDPIYRSFVLLDYQKSLANT